MTRHFQKLPRLKYFYREYHAPINSILTETSIQMYLTFVQVILLNRMELSMQAMFPSEQIVIKRLFTSLALLFSLSLRGVNSEIEILFLSDFSESAKYIFSLVLDWMFCQNSSH